MTKAAETFTLTAPISGRSSYIGRRFAVLESVAVTNSASTTAEIDLREYSGGTVHCRNGSSLSSLTVWSGEKLGGTYEALKDLDGNAVTITIAANEARPIPDECFGCHFIRLVGDASDSTIDITLKA